MVDKLSQKMSDAIKDGYRAQIRSGLGFNLSDTRTRNALFRRKLIYNANATDPGECDPDDNESDNDVLVLNEKGIELAKSFFMPNPGEYLSVNDAANNLGIPGEVREVLKPGDAEVYYMTHEGFSKWHSKLAFSENKELPTPEEIVDGVDDNDNHLWVQIGKVNATIDNLDKLSYALQGDFWSPNGEADWIMSSMNGGPGHTTLSVGDAIKVDERWFVAMGFGWDEIKEPTLPLPPEQSHVQTIETESTTITGNDQIPICEICKTLMEKDVMWGWECPKCDREDESGKEDTNKDENDDNEDDEDDDEDDDEEPMVFTSLDDEDEDGEDEDEDETSPPSLDITPTTLVEEVGETESIDKCYDCGGTWSHECPGCGKKIEERYCASCDVEGDFVCIRCRGKDCSDCGKAMELDELKKIQEWVCPNCCIRIPRDDNPEVEVAVGHQGRYLFDFY